MNGRLGLSAHHCIHGNNPEYVVIKNIKMINYEVAAIGINGFKHLSIHDVEILGQNTEIPVLAIHSSMKFASLFLNDICTGANAANATIHLDGSDLGCAEIEPRLRCAINTTWEALILTEIPPSWWTSDDTLCDTNYTNMFEDTNCNTCEIYKLVANEAGIVDGNCAGIILNGHGPSVNAFPETIKDPA